MTGRNPDGIEDFPSPGCSDVAYGPQRLNAIIGAYEAFLDPVCGTDDLSFRLVLELPATETPSALRHPPAPNWMIWERHHIEVVRAAAAGNARRAADLLREHLASIGCDPLAFRIAAMLRQPAGKNDDLENLASQLPGLPRNPMAMLTMTASHPPATTQHSESETLPATHIARRDQAMTPPATVSARGQERPVAHRRTAVVVGVLFLSFTVTFFIGNTLIHSYFSSATKPAGTLITGVLLIGLSGLADAAVGLAMRPVLTPYAPVRSQVYWLPVAPGWLSWRALPRREYV